MHAQQDSAIQGAIGIRNIVGRNLCIRVSSKQVGGCYTSRPQQFSQANSRLSSQQVPRSQPQQLEVYSIGRSAAPGRLDTCCLLVQGLWLRDAISV